MQELKTRYPKRLVLFDLPPLLSADDALAFSPYVDAVLVVVEEGGTRTDELSRAMEYLRETNVLGVVLNKSAQVLTPLQAGVDRENTRYANQLAQLEFGKADALRNPLMYESFYKLNEKPFSLLPDAGFLYFSEKHSTALSSVGFTGWSVKPDAR